MPVGLPVALALLAQAASAAAPNLASGPAAPPNAPAIPAKPAEDDCSAAQRDANSREIVICAQRTDGYRLNRDIMEAKREMKNNSRPHNPHETFRPNDCASVGPMGCRGGPTINVLAAALTAAEMARRAASGQEIGSMFKTTPAPTEYELYLEAKKRREAEEAAKAASKVKAAAAAKADAAKSAQAPTH